MKKRILSFLLAILMVVSIFPSQAFATDNADAAVTPTEGVTEPTTEAATEPPCDTCGQYDCSSEHLNWCAACKKDDCGVDHTATEPQCCDKCGSTECTGHENWCDLCKIDNCGKEHKQCETCGAVDCTVDHDAPAPTAAPTEPVQPASDEETPDYSGDIGRYVKLNTAVQNFTVYGLTPSTGTLDTQTFMHEDFQTGTILRIANWMMMDETVWYQVTFYKGGTQGSYVGDFPAEPWFRQTEAGELVFLSTCGICSKPDCAGHTWCETCEKYDCGIDHSQPENPCNCGCESCTGAEGCECKCGNCDFCEKEPENTCVCGCKTCTGAEGCECFCGSCQFCEAEPTVPSISATVNGQTVTVTGDTLPEGISLKSTSNLIEKYDVFTETEYDISLVLDGQKYEPDFPVQVTISGLDVVSNSYVRITHYLEDEELIAKYAGTDSVILVEDVELAAKYPAAAKAAYNALGKTNTVCLELLLSSDGTVRVSNGSITYSPKGFSINVIASTGYDASLGYHYAVYDDDNGTPVNSNGYAANHEITMDNHNGDTYWVTRGQRVYIDSGYYSLQGNYSGDYKDWTQSSDRKETRYILYFTVNPNAEFYKKHSVRMYSDKGWGDPGGDYTIYFYVVPEVQLNFNANLPAGANGSGINIPTSKKTVLGMGTQNIPYSRTYVSLPSGAPTGYTFNGWYTKADGGTPVSSGTYVYLRQEDATFVGGTNNDQYRMDLYAHWKANDYTVTFNPNNGSVSPTSKTVTYNSTYGELPTPTRTGYSFDGWYTAASGGTQVTADTIYQTAGNTTLYAHWSINQHTIIWLDGFGTALKTENLSYGAAVTPPANPTKAGYEFDGWDPAAPATMPDYDVTITAKWKKVTTFTVTWKNWDGTVLETDGNVASGTTPTYDGATPTKPADAQYSYTFDKWSPDVAAVTGDVTYTAQFKETVNRYTLSGKIDHGTVTGPVTVNYGESASITFTPSTGYAFVQCQIDDEAPDLIDESAPRYTITHPNLNKNIHAVVTTKLIHYTISYELNGGNLGEGVTNPTTYTVETETFTLNNPTKTGYKFMGWATDENATTGEETVTIEKGSTGEKTYYATWEKLGHKVTYQYSTIVPDGAPKLPEESRYAVGDTVTLKELPIIFGDYRITTWYAYDAQSKSVPITDGKFTMPDSDVVIRGSWYTSMTGRFVGSNSNIMGTFTNELAGSTSDNQFNIRPMLGVHGGKKVTATAADNYIIVDVTVNGVQDLNFTEKEYVYTVPEGGPYEKIDIEVHVIEKPDLTVSLSGSGSDQNFVFEVTRSDGVAFDPIDVVLCSENNFRVTIKDLPVGEYTVTEKNDWSWRENAVNSQTVDLSTTSQTVYFDFGDVDDLHWLSGYSYKRKKGGS